MKKIDKFIEFFVENKDDKRINIFKKIKYGYKYYHIQFTIDEDPSNLKNNHGYFSYRENMEILFDNRNQCVEIFGGDEKNSIIIEDIQLLEKWSNILEDIVSSNIENRAVDVFEKTISECYNKNLYRELQMKKLFKEDESI